MYALDGMERDDDVEQGNHSAGDPVTFDLNAELFRFIAYIFFWVMVVLTIVVTKLTVVIPNPNPLELKLGYTNICINVDYDPAMAYIFPFVEYAMVLYVILNWCSAYKIFRNDNNSHMSMFFTISTTITEVLLIAWFRIITVTCADENIAGHTIPFMGLQLSLAMISVQNCIFYCYLEQINTPE